MPKFPPFHPVVASYVNNHRTRRALGMDQVPEHVHGDPGARMVTHNTSTGQFYYVDAEPVCGDLDWDDERQGWVCIDGPEDAPVVLFGIEFRPPSAEDRATLDYLPARALVARLDRTVLTYDQQTGEIYEDWVEADGEPHARVWSYKLADPNTAFRV